MTISALSAPSLTPLTRYQEQLQQTGFVADPEQLIAIKELESLYQQLTKKTGIVGKKNRPTGLYLWGRVGTGKTFLMDLFYQSLPETNKLRLHYQQFMSRIHQELKAQTGNKNPLQIIARKLAGEIRVLCLDELYITDIGDGMIIYQLLDNLFSEGVVLVTTSNFPMEQLYQDDLQPALFEPAIALLKSHTRTVHLAGQQDYRLLQGNALQNWFVYENSTGDGTDHPSLAGSAAFTELFNSLNQHRPYLSESLTVLNRSIETVRYNDTLGWFSFEALCCGPRSPGDYIALTRRFETIMISGIPQLGGKPGEKFITYGTEDNHKDSNIKGARKQIFTLKENAERRFISLIDQLYDQGIHLYIEAACPLEQLYSGGSLAFEFQRTQSRLTEMQSDNYLRQAR